MNELATLETPLVKASAQLSQFLGIETTMMLDTIKAQCFKSVTPDKVSDEQLAAFVSIAAALRINPLLPGMLYAFPGKNGSIEPIIGPDGVFMLLTNNPDIVAGPDGSAWWTVHGKEGEEETCTGFIFHKHKGLIKKTIRLSEWEVKTNPNWVTRPYHMADIRAIKQCARQIIHGLPMDEDERKISEMVNVTRSDPGAAQESPATEQPARPRSRRGTQAATTPPSETPAIDVTTTPAQPATTAAPQDAAQPPAPAVEKKALKPVEPAAAPQGLAKANPAAAAPPITKAKFTPKPTKQLQPDEIQLFACEVVEIQKRPLNGKASVVAELKGQFTGQVIHIGCGTFADASNPDSAITAPPQWQLERPVLVKLKGRKLADTDAVCATVESIEFDGAPKGAAKAPEGDLNLG